MKKMKKLSPIESKAKLGVLEQLRKEMQDMMGDKMAGMKKVTVASPDKHGLEMGLEKAQHLLGDHGNADDEQVEGAEEELGEDLDHDHEAGEPASHIEKMMQHGFGDDGAEHDEDGDESPEHMGHEDDEESLDAKIQELLKKKAALKK